MLKNVEIGLLNDYYGGLLTAYQSDTLSRYYDDDLSLSEIAEEQGVSRQAVMDVIKRAELKLKEYESKLGLVGKIQKLQSELESLMVSVDTETAQKLQTILNEVKDI